jgi:tetratricopeptide (TPR) repeat protein
MIYAVFRLREQVMNGPRKLCALIVCSATLIVPASVAKQTKSPDLFLSKGDACMQEGRYLDAIDQYSRAIKIDKRNPNYYQLRARAELSASKFKAVVADASKSVKYTPDDPNGYELRAKAFDKLEEYKKEKPDLDKLIGMRPNTGSYLLQRAQACLKLKQMEQVITDCNQAIHLGLERNQLADLYKMRSVAYKKLGNKVDAAREQSKYQSLQ